jgi:hypothetical protein
MGMMTVTQELTAAERSWIEDRLATLEAELRFAGSGDVRAILSEIEDLEFRLLDAEGL